MRKSLLGAVAAFSTLLGGVAQADMCHLSWDVPCCPVPGCKDMGKAEVVLTICNCTDVTNDYQWFFPDDNINAMPFQGSVTLQPGQCVDIPITIFCDPMAVGEENIFTVVVQNQTDGSAMKCQGSIRNTGDVKAMSGPQVVGVDTPGPVNVSLTASNTSDVPVQWAPRVMVMPDGAADVRPIQPLVLQAGETRTLEVRVNRWEIARGANPDNPFIDLIYMWDMDGDGDLEAGASTTLKIDLAACPGDLDGDGRVGSSDLAILLAGWGSCF